MKKHTGTKKLYNCEICNKTLTTKQTFENHAKTHQNLKSFACDICEKQYFTQATLKHHINKIHEVTEIEKAKCEICSKNIQKSSMSSHLRIHSDLLIQCDICYNHYPGKSGLNEHMITHQSMDKKPQCKECGGLFSNTKNLKNHAKIHQGVKTKSTCEICFKILDKTSMKDHMRSHGEAIQCVQCEICMKKYSSTESLGHHMKFVHVGVREKEKCNVCHREVYYLSIHIKNVHNK